MSSPSPAPIEPDGLLDGLDWGSILRGALLDVFLTILASIPLLLYLAGPEAFAEDESVASQAVDEALASPEGLALSFAIGFAGTVAGAYYGSRRAGAFHVRHGGWIAVVSLLLAVPFYLVPGAGSTPSIPLWYDVLGILATVPAGLLGGLLARAADSGAAR